MTSFRHALGLLGLTLLVAGCGKSTSGSDGSGGTSVGGSESGGTTGQGGGSTGGTGTGGTSGSGGSGGSGGVDSISCGDLTCDGLSLGIPNAPTAMPCCIDDEDGGVSCGLSTDVLNDFGVMLPAMCQPLDGPGELDEDCPVSTSVEIPNTSLSFTFPGCCLPTGLCGYYLDTAAGIFELGLGCVDTSMFPEAPEPTSCTPGGGGSGGSGGMGDGGQAGSP